MFLPRIEAWNHKRQHVMMMDSVFGGAVLIVSDVNTTVPVVTIPRRLYTTFIPQITVRVQVHLVPSL